MADNGTVITPVFTALFPNLFVPRPIKINGKEKGEPVFGVTMLFDKASMSPEDQDRLKTLIETAQRVAREKWPGRDFKVEPIAMPFKQGDKEAEKSEKRGKNGDFYKGKLVLKTNSKFKPQVVGLDRKEIINDKLVYSGCLMYAEVNFVAYDSVNGGTDGVKAYLGNFVMKAKDGPRIAGKSAADVFAGIGGADVNDDPTAGMGDDEIPF